MIQQYGAPVHRRDRESMIRQLLLTASDWPCTFCVTDQGVFQSAYQVTILLSCKLINHDHYFVETYKDANLKLSLKNSSGNFLKLTLQINAI